MLVEEPAQEVGGQERRGAVEHEHVAFEPVERALRGCDRVAGTARLALHRDLDALGDVLAARRDDDHGPVGAELADGVERPVEHALAEQRVQVLRRPGAHARTEAGGHDDDCEWAAHAADDGWGARIRTWDRGTKTRCLTTWLRPSERIVSPSAAPRGSGEAGTAAGAVYLRSLKRTSSATAAKIAASRSAPQKRMNANTTASTARVCEAAAIHDTCRTVSERASRPTNT